MPTADENRAQLNRLRVDPVTPPIPPVPKIASFIDKGVLTQAGAKAYDDAMEEWRKKAVALLQPNRT